MRHLRRLLTIATVSLAIAPTWAGASSSWHAGTALTLPAGSNGSNGGIFAQLSCPSAGNCVAAGSYSVAGFFSSTIGATVLTESNHVWSTSPKVITPEADAATNPGMTVNSLVCVAVGNCVMVGSYTDANGLGQAFVASASAGTWSAARKLSLPKDANSASQNASAKSVSCSSSGNCIVAGTYFNATGSGRLEGFIVVQQQGAWLSPVTISLPSDASVNPLVTIGQTGCASSTLCTATGGYTNVDGIQEAFTVTTNAGTVATAQRTALPADASTYAGASFSEITCAQLTCTAVGTYISTTGATQLMAATLASGRWSHAVAVSAPTNAAHNPKITLYGFDGIACSSAGNCVSGGQYVDNAGGVQGFLVNEVGGLWQRAQRLKLPSDATQAGHNGGVVSLSCSSNGNCAAGAAYLDGSSNYQAGIVSEVNGVWQTVTKIALPAGATTVGQGGGVYALVCATSSCEALGTYQDQQENYPVFATSNF